LHSEKSGLGDEVHHTGTRTFPSRHVDSADLCRLAIPDTPDRLRLCRGHLLLWILRGNILVEEKGVDAGIDIFERVDQSGRGDTYGEYRREAFPWPL